MKDLETEFERLVREKYKLKITHSERSIIIYPEGTSADKSVEIDKFYREYLDSKNNQPPSAI